MNLRLKFAILESGKKQKRVAQLAGLKQPRLSAIIHNDAEPNEDERRALARILKRQPSELFDDAEVTR